MRVVHISTVDATGGAARAALRLHKGLREIGVNSEMVVQSKSSNDPSIHQIEKTSGNSSALAELIQRGYIDLNRTDLSTTYFSAGFSGIDLRDDPRVAAADVLNLHWVAGFQNPVSIAALQELGKPMVWTLHDQRAFTGGCHFSAGCAKFEQGCIGCPQLADDPAGFTSMNLFDSAVFLTPRAITVVAPSRWLAECARRSLLFRKSRVEVIPYGIEHDVFAPRDRATLREELGLSPSVFYFLVGADHGSEKRKGFRELREALAISMAEEPFARRVQNGEIQFLSFGRTSPELENGPVPVRSLGYINSDQTMAAVYGAADVYILPSLEDNLPNTLLEAMSCGTPVVAFNTGGVPDMVEPKVTGWIAPCGNTKILANAILQSAQATNLGAMRLSSRNTIERRCSLEKQARAYENLYRDLQKLGIASSKQNPREGERHVDAILPQLVFTSAEKCLPHVRKGEPNLVYNRKALLKLKHLAGRTLSSAQTPALFAERVETFIRAREARAGRSWFTGLKKLLGISLRRSEPPETRRGR
jgi:glycosyltransferase involved in cell wall biosynthesis